MPSLRHGLIVGVLSLLPANLAMGQQWAATISGGYSALDLDKSGRYGHVYTFGKSGGYIDADIATKVAHAPLPLLLGGGLSWTEHKDTPAVAAQFTTSPYQVFPSVATTDFSQISLEARAAVPLFFSGSQGWFVAPRIGAGVSYMRFKGEYIFSETLATYVARRDFAGYEFEIRPALQAGYELNRFAVGGEVSYMAGFGNFGPFGSVGRECRTGIFLRYRF